jgi:hypothetical protein
MKVLRPVLAALAVLTLGLSACSKTRTSLNPFDPSGPDSSFSTSAGNGWTYAKVGPGIATQYYANAAVAPATMVVQDSSGSNTINAYVRVDLSGLHQPSNVIKATLTGDFTIDDMTFYFGLLNAPFDGTVTWATRPSFTYMSSAVRQGYPSSGGGWGWPYQVSLDVTTLVQHMVAEGSQNYGFVIYGVPLATNGNPATTMDISQMSLQITYHPT